MFKRLREDLMRFEALLARFEAIVTEMEFQRAVGVNRLEEKPDPEQERRNRMFNEGLDNLLSYDGRPQEARNDAEG